MTDSTTLDSLTLDSWPTGGPDEDALADADLAPPQDPNGGLLPDWYMPATGGVLLSGWRRAVALTIVVAFFAITAYGLCSTYGEVAFL